MKELNAHFDDLICGIAVIEKESREIVYINKVAEELIGLSSNEVIGNRCHNFICPAEITSCPIIDLGQEVDCSEKSLLTSQEPIPILKKVREVSIDGKLYLLESFIDISEQKKQQEVLLLQGETDPLTGLMNRVALNVYINKNINITNYSLLLIDVDRFKSINDQFGHSVGDIVLQEFSHLLQKTLRNIDKLFRWGGEEFLVIIEDEDAVKLSMTIAERIRNAMENTTFSHINKLTVSIGVAIHHDSLDFHTLFDIADKYLMEAKNSGRNKVCGTPE